MMIEQAEKLISSPIIENNLSYAPRDVVDEFFNALVILDGAVRENATMREKCKGTWEIKLDIPERNVQKTYHLVETKMPRTYDLKDISIDPTLIDRIMDVKIAYILTKDPEKTSEIDELQTKAFSDNVYLPVDIGVHFSERITDIIGGRVDHMLLQSELRDILGPEAIEEEMNRREEKRDINNVNIYADPEKREFISSEKIDLLKHQFQAQKREKELYEKEKNIREYVERMNEERRIKEEIINHRKERDSELNAYVKEIKEKRHEQELQEMLELEERILQRNENFLDKQHRENETPAQKQARLKLEFEEKSKLEKKESARIEQFEAEKEALKKRNEKLAEYEAAEKEKEASRMRRSLDKTEIVSEALPEHSIERSRLEEERLQREMMEQESKRLREQVSKVNANNTRNIDSKRDTSVTTTNTSGSINALQKNWKKEENYMKITAADFIVNRDISWYEANIIKYVCRHKECDGIVDIEKAIKSVDLLVETKKSSNFHHNKPNDSEVISTKEFIIKNDLTWVEGSIVKLIVESENSDDILVFEEVKDLLRTIIEFHYK